MAVDSLSWTIRILGINLNSRLKRIDEKLPKLERTFSSLFFLRTGLQSRRPDLKVYLAGVAAIPGQRNIRCSVFTTLRRGLPECEEFWWKHPANDVGDKVYLLDLSGDKVRSILLARRNRRKKKSYVNEGKW